MRIAGADVNSFYVAIAWSSGPNEVGWVVLPSDKKAKQQPALQRMRDIYLSLKDWLFRNRIDIVYIEEIPYVRNPKTARELISVRAVTALAFLDAGTDVRFIDNKVWKKRIVGKGSADKEAVADWVRSNAPSVIQSANLQDVYDAWCVLQAGIEGELVNV
jgi:Holliday junction resolvasome RuvABC endonuclease subunit